jgi:hypothetical protein
MMMLSETHSRATEGALRDEIGRVEALLIAGKVGSIRQQTTGRVVGKAVVRAMEAAISFLRAPQQAVSLLTLRSSVRVARRLERLASRARRRRAADRADGDGATLPGEGRVRDAPAATDARPRAQRVGMTTA